MPGFKLLKLLGTLLVLGIVAILIAVFVFKQKPANLLDLGINLKDRTVLIFQRIGTSLNWTAEERIYQYGEFIKVTRVIDGDTVILENGDKLRYIGINTPELNSADKTECFALEATTENQRLVENKKIRIEKDVSERDQYGRLLGYVYLEDGTFVNLELVKNGFASASSYPPDVAKANLFRELEMEARIRHLGLWGKCQ